MSGAQAILTLHPGTVVNANNYAEAIGSYYTNGVACLVSGGVRPAGSVFYNPIVITSSGTQVQRVDYQWMVGYTPPPGLKWRAQLNANSGAILAEYHITRTTWSTPHPDMEITLNRSAVGIGYAQYAIYGSYDDGVTSTLLFNMTLQADRRT